MQISVLFEWTEKKNPYRRVGIKVSDRDAREKAIQLSEDVLLDKISDVVYSVIYPDKKTEAKELDYFNDIL